MWTSEMKSGKHGFNINELEFGFAGFTCGANYAQLRRMMCCLGYLPREISYNQNSTLWKNVETNFPKQARNDMLDVWREAFSDLKSEDRQGEGIVAQYDHTVCFLLFASSNELLYVV